MKLNLDALLSACADDSFDDGIRIDTELEPLSGPGGTVKPAVYEGGKYQLDRRWASPEDDGPTDVVVIDNVPSQANRLEDALRRHRESIGLPEIVLDFGGLPELPVHLPSRLSSLQFPHRNADAYLRDSQKDGKDFVDTRVGKAILEATPWSCGALMSWFPQALLYGFWQSHLGKKGIQTKHARAWVSEIVGWNPAATGTRAMGLKGDPLNLSVDEKVRFSLDNQKEWGFGKEAKAAGGKNDKLSEIGHGQVPFMKESDASPASVSFERVTQRATLSLAQLRRISLEEDGDSRAEEAARRNTAARALLVALGLHAHTLAFGKGFALRSGAELRPAKTPVTWLGGTRDSEVETGGAAQSAALLHAARKNAKATGVPLDGWGLDPLVLEPKSNLRKAIQNTWPSPAE